MNQEHRYCWFNLREPENNIYFDRNERISEGQAISEIRKLLPDIDESDTFSSRVLYYLNSRKLTTKDLYERAYVDRRLFHKIAQNPDYHPSKKTVFALCIAFRLSYQESQNLLALASYAFAPNSRGDMIYRYCFIKRIYDIDAINNVLYQFGCPCVGE